MCFVGLYVATMSSKLSVRYMVPPVSGLQALASRPDLLPVVKRESIMREWIEVRLDGMNGYGKKIDVQVAR